ncbi:MAG: DUF6951 family protein [bacterium]
MTKIELDPGICGFITVIEVTSKDKNNVEVNVNSECHYIENAGFKNIKINIKKEFSKKLHNTKIYKKSSNYIPHLSCPIYVGIFKAIEAETRMLLPEDVSIKFGKKQ